MVEENVIPTTAIQYCFLKLMFLGSGLFAMKPRSETAFSSIGGYRSFLPVCQ